jgi:hypothetical protein
VRSERDEGEGDAPARLDIIWAGEGKSKRKEFHSKNKNQGEEYPNINLVSMNILSRQ